MCVLWVAVSVLVLVEFLYDRYQPEGHSPGGA